MEEEEEEMEGGGGGDGDGDGDGEKEDIAKPPVECCECGLAAVSKVVGPRSENKGLRYLCCRRFVFFGKKKKNYCRFFKWVDEPRQTKEQKKEAQAEKKKKKIVCASATLMQPSVRTRSVIREVENQCKTLDSLKEEKDNHGSILATCGDKHSQVTSARCGYANLLLNDDSHTKSREILPRELVTNMRISFSQEKDLDSGRHESTCVEESNKAFGKDNEISKSSSCANIIDQLGKISGNVDGLNEDIQLVMNFVAEESKDERTIPNQDFNAGLKKSFPDTEQETCEESISHMLEAPNCLCSCEAVLKTVKSRGPNKGLRFWVCANSHPFYEKFKKRKAAMIGESCKFFRWIDTPVNLEMWEEEVKRRKEVQKRRELSLLV